MNIKPYTYYQPPNKQEYNKIVYNVPYTSIDYQHGFNYGRNKHQNISKYWTHFGNNKETGSSRYNKINTIELREKESNDGRENQWNPSYIDEFQYYDYGKRENKCNLIEH